MMLSRWRRVATGVAAGVIVLCAALLGSALRSENAGVSVASDLRPANATPIVIDDSEATDPDTVVVIEDPEPVADTDEPGDEIAGASETGDSQTDDSDDAASGTAGDGAASDTDDSAGSDTDTADNADGSEAGDAGDSAAENSDAGDTDDAADSAAGGADTGSADNASSDTGGAETGSTQTPAPTPVPAAPAAGDGSLGTGGGVDDAECALDRLVIYAGARVGGVAGSIRNALAQAGFGAGCPAPVTVLASNCPLQFAGVLGAGSGYDPGQSYVAASSNVDRATMTSVMGTVGYTGSEINILNFGFVNPDQPGEQWMAIFIPPSFTGWENLAARAGLPTTSQSLCAPSGELAG